MTELTWLAVVSALLSVITALFAVGFHDMRHTLKVLERRQKLVIASLLRFAITREPEEAHQLLARAIEKLLENGSLKEG